LDLIGSKVSIAIEANCFYHKLEWQFVDLDKRSKRDESNVSILWDFGESAQKRLFECRKFTWRFERNINNKQKNRRKAVCRRCLTVFNGSAFWKELSREVVSRNSLIMGRKAVLVSAKWASPEFSGLKINSTVGVENAITLCTGERVIKNTEQRGGFLHGAVET